MIVCAVFFEVQSTLMSCIIFNMISSASLCFSTNQTAQQNQEQNLISCICCLSFLCMKSSSYAFSMNISSLEKNSFYLSPVFHTVEDNGKSDLFCFYILPVTKSKERENRWRENEPQRTLRRHQNCSGSLLSTKLEWTWIDEQQLNQRRSDRKANELISRIERIEEAKWREFCTHRVLPCILHCIHGPNSITCSRFLSCPFSLHRFSFFHFPPSMFLLSRRFLPLISSLIDHLIVLLQNKKLSLHH